MLTLTSILSTPESSYLEGKSAKGGFPDSFWESYSAFANIRFGERAGSGLNGIVYVWKKVYHIDPEIFVKEEYDRTFLKLPTLGREPDVEAMAEFYPDEEETSDNGTVNENAPVNVTVNDPINENVRVNVRVNDPIIHQLICLLSDNPYISALQLADHLNKTERHIRRILSKLQSEGTIRRVGADKNGHWEVINNQSDK